MRRIFLSARTALLFAAGATPFLIASDEAAVAQFLDPGWQIVYAGRSNSGGGLVDSMFGDGMGMPAVAQVYQPMQPAPMYYQPMPAPQPRVYQPPQVYYQPVPAYQAPVARAYQPVPVYYSQAATQQLRGYQPTPVYYQQAPVQQSAATAPGYYQRVAAQQPSVSQAEPRYTGTTPPQQGAAQSSAPRGLMMQTQSPQNGAPTLSQSNRAPRQAVAQNSWHPYQSDQSPPGTVQSSWHSYQSGPAPQPQGFFQFIPQPQPATAYNAPPPAYAPSSYGDMAHPTVDPKYDRQLVDYQTDQPAGTIIVDTQHYFLYLVMEDGKAMRYGIGVGREGFTWSGVNQISAMREWPEWRPPNEMLERRPDLPRFVAGGLDNPLGARALYLGSTLYRIHGSNEPWTIGTNVSSGCIRLRNADIIDLYDRVKIGTKVVVM